MAPDPDAVVKIVEGVGTLLGFIWAPILLIIPALSKIASGATEIAGATKNGKNQYPGNTSEF